MDNMLLSFTTLLLVAVVSCTRSQVLTIVPGVSTMEELNTLSKNPVQETSALINPLENEDEIFVDNLDETIPTIPADDMGKRGGIFRFGKRQGSLFRFGKRGSLFRFGKRGSLLRFGKRGSLLRFGKRQGSLFRFGKRAGSLLRFGRAGSDDVPVESTEEGKRTLFRFGKRSDIDVMQDSLADYTDLRSKSHLEDSRSNRGIDSFHWGNEYDHE